jgi:hypothetical protein
MLLHASAHLHSIALFQSFKTSIYLELRMFLSCVNLTISESTEYVCITFWEIRKSATKTYELIKMAIRDITMNHA